MQSLRQEVHFRLGKKIVKGVPQSPSTKAEVVIGTGLGRSAFHCYPVLKAVMGYITFFFKELVEEGEGGHQK